MRIGVLSIKSGVSRDTIRYYEQLGLLGTIEKNGAYKAYTAQSLRRLELIRTAKNMGFTLHEISEVMDAWEGDGLNVDTKRQLLTKKIEQIQIKFNDLSQLKISLEAILVKVEQRCDDGLITSTQANA